MNAISPTPPELLLAHLLLREGWSVKVYRDTRLLPTAGMGHLLSKAEHELYPVGMRVPNARLEAWRQKDTMTAYAEAIKQATALGFVDQRLVNALTSVVFQLGPKWYLPESHGGKGFVHTWSLMGQHKWVSAASEVVKSNWAKETPVRVKDFQETLLAIASSASDDEVDEA